MVNLLKEKTDLVALDLNWIYTVDNFGRLEERELVKDGKNKPVTRENIHEYV